MAQTASVLSAEQSLYITEDESAIVSTSSELRQSPAGWITTFAGQPVVFSYGHRLRFHFIPGAEHAPHFALIRGLMEFNRPKELSFVYHVAAKSFEIDIDSAYEDTLQALLSQVDTLLVKELAFRRKLKAVIAFEQRYQREKDEVYASFL